MMETFKPYQRETYLIHPKKFVLWLFIVASIMLFAGFTSAYIVRRGEGNWELFRLPAFFYINTFVILVSSVFMQLSLVHARKENFPKLKIFLNFTLVLAIAFCAGQLYAWKQMVQDNVFFAFSNPSNAFVYVISGIHLTHVLAGMIFIFSIIIQAHKFKVNKEDYLYISMCATYWHFIGILWVYLITFLFLFR